MSSHKYRSSQVLKTIIAFSALLIVVIASLVLSAFSKPSDVYPTENTKIRLYGETHGLKSFYNAELDLWKDRYSNGYRALFLELPYYTAEYLNIWMNEDSDEIINQIFEDLKGTLDGNNFYYEFFHKIKKNCPETVFYGTDVGHQGKTTGARYLKFLSENGLEDSEEYRLAKECIDQGTEYLRCDVDDTGMTAVRESYMTSNFISAYSRCNTDKIMGIYGSYHIDQNDPDIMAGKLKAHYGDIISTVDILNILKNGGDPYRLGFCVTGFIFLLMLYVPNIYWGIKAKPDNYDEEAKKENRFFLLFERIGEVLVTCSLLVFPAANPPVRVLPDSVLIDWKILLCIAALILMILYEGYWIKYFKSNRSLRDFYSSFAGFPLAGATLPVIAVFLLGLNSGNLILIASGIILGIGHIGIHYQHWKESGQ